MTQPPDTAQPDALKLAANRKQLRQTLLEQRRTLEPAQRSVLDAELCEQLLVWCAQHRPTCLAVYMPIQAEPDLSAAYPQLIQMGVQLALPWVREKHQPLSFLAWHPDDAMQADEHGIPAPANRSALCTPDVVLIPCVGINAQAYRLGYGGGYYDRTLTGMYRPLALGVAYPCAQAEFTPTEHDIPMDVVLLA